MENKKSLTDILLAPFIYVIKVFLVLSIHIYHFSKSVLYGALCLFYPILYFLNSDKYKATKEADKRRKLEELERKRSEIIAKRAKQQQLAIMEKQRREQAKMNKLAKNKRNLELEAKREEHYQAQLEKKRQKEEMLLRKEAEAKELKLHKLKLKEEKRKQRLASKSKEKSKDELNIEKEKLKEERAKLKEEKRLQKLDLYKQKQIEKQRAIEAKDRKKKQEQLEKIKREKERKKRLNEKYESEDYKKVSIFNTRLKNIPEAIKKRWNDYYNNLTIVKNIKNKRDINRQALLLSFEGDDAKKSDEKLTYQYTAKDPKGKLVRDYFDAYSKVEVHSFLLSEGYEVYSIKTSSLIQFLNGNVVRTKIKMKDLIFFLTQLSTYIKSGIALVDSLKILSRQYKKKSYQKIFRAIIYDLTMGDSFSQALEKQGTTFPKLLVNMVKAAEMTGDLAETLDDMANYYTETEKTRKQMVTALMYPTIILIVAIAVLSFIMIYIIPKFVAIYESMDASQIPGITLAVLSFSEFMQKYYIILFLGFVGFIILFKILYSTVKVFRTAVQWLAMHLPVFGNIIIYNEVTMFTKTFSSLLRHNVFITDSMEILNKITNNEIFKMLILDTITNLARGDKISLAFQDHWAFPIPAYEMIVTGEKTGQLAEMMTKVADYYQELHKNLVIRMKTFIEPILIVFLTVIVGIIILSIVVPMFNIYSVVQMQ